MVRVAPIFGLTV